MRGRVSSSAPERVSEMEKFIIEGGTPLAGTVTPAGNKNAALPALAASLLTREEVVLRNIPRIADVEAMLELLRLPRREGRVARRQRRGAPGRRAQPLRGGPRLGRAHPRLLPARRPAARPPRPRRHAAARRRRDRPPPARPAPRRLPRARRGGERGPQLVPAGGPRGPPRVRLLHGRAVGHGDRERADGRRAHARLDRDPQRRLGAARPGPRPAADGDGRPHRGHRLEPHDRPRPGGARRRRLHDRPGLHRGGQLHRARGLHRRRAAHHATRSRTTSA